MTGHGEISEEVLGKFQALSQQSMRRAGESLSSLLGYPVRLEVSGIRALPIRALPGLGAAADTGLTAGLRFQITGEGGGHMVILLPLPTIFRMLRALLGTPEEPRPLSEQERSAVQEVGNILVSSFLSGMGDLLGKRLIPTPPQIAFDYIPRLMQQVVAELRSQGPEVLVVQALFQDPEREIEGRFVILSEVAALERMVQPASGGHDEQRSET
jgi:chemotaxis protein CheC